MLERYGFYPASNFINNTTIQGPKAIFSRNGHMAYRLVFIPIIVTAIGFCSWQVSCTVQSFLQYNAKISQSRVIASEIEFPAITICPTTIYNRLLVGSTAQMVQVAYMNSKSPYHDITQATKLCSASGPPLVTTNNLYPSVYNSTRAFMMDLFPTSLTSILSCKLKGQLAPNCAQWFLHKMTDIGFCYTFNQAQQLVDDYPTTDDAGTFGSTVPNTILSKTGGRNDGVSMFMVANQTQYCIPAGLYVAGYVVLVHSRDVEPRMYVKPLMYLSPGFVFNIGIKVTKVQRNLENYPNEQNPFCYNSYPLQFYPKDKVYRNGDNWVKNCMCTYVWSECKCLPNYAPPLARDVVNMSGRMDVFCSFNATSSAQRCLERLETKVMTGQICFSSEMPKPCQETKYSTTLTASWLSFKNPFGQTINENLTITEFRQSYLVANFFLASMDYKWIAVNPSMTWVDLMNQVGGAVGMALGISLISMFELGSWLFLTTIAVCLRVKEMGKPNKHEEHCVYLP